MRAMLLALERRLDAKIPVTHKVVTWLVEHAADILNKFAVGIDGRTAYERIKGKKFHGEMVEFGRGEMYKIPCKSEGRTDDGQVGSWNLVGQEVCPMNMLLLLTLEKCARLRPYVCCPTQKAGVWTASTISSEHLGTRKEMIKLNGERSRGGGHPCSTSIGPVSSCATTTSVTRGSFSKKLHQERTFVKVWIH